MHEDDAGHCPQEDEVWVGMGGAATMVIEQLLPGCFKAVIAVIYFSRYAFTTVSTAMCFAPIPSPFRTLLVLRT